MQPLPVVFFLLFVCQLLPTGSLQSVCNKNIVSANGVFSGRQNLSSISVCNGARGGEWTWTDMCPKLSYANGFSIKLEKYGGPLSDDTAINGIRLYCSTNQELSGVIYTVESDSGKFGQWSNVTWCPDNSILSSFQLKVELPKHDGDETAVNNIRFRCTNGAIIETVGGQFGEYDKWSQRCVGRGICGLKTRQEQYKGIFGDDTSLNNVIFFCCE